MRLHRFFIDNETLAIDGSFVIEDSEIIHQWKDVFRLKAGDEVILLDNSGSEFRSKIISISKDGAEVVVEEQKSAKNTLAYSVWLFSAIIKNNNYEFILEKGTEVGVSHFVPVLSERSEKKNLNLERSKRIIKESSEQCGRGKMPELHEVIDLEKVFDFAKENGVSLVAFHLEGEKFTNMVRDTLISGDKIGILIGPEGGWSESELEAFKANNIPIYTLGQTVLRAETASIVVPALLLI